MDFNKILEFLIQLGISLGGKLIAAGIILLIGVKINKWFKRWIKTSAKLEKLDMGVRSFLASFSSISIYIILFITVAMTLGIPTTSFITALASCGVAIGLALQGTLSNFAGGLMILLFKPFKVGDYIETAGESGTVDSITVVYTVLRTPDNKMITIPNGSLTNSVIENYSTNDTRRVDMVFTAAYDCDVEKVKGILMNAVQNHEKVFKDPEPFVRMTEHGESALTYTVRVWCKKEDYWDVRFDITERIRKDFAENNVEIPFPQIEIHQR